MMYSSEQAAMTARPAQPKLRLAGAVSIAACIALANLFALVYVANERYIFFWDYSIYWEKYRDLGALLCADPGAGLARLLQSIRYSEYSDLAILPIAPLFCVAGPSRMAFILAMVNLLLIPTALIGGLLAARLMRADSGPHGSLALATTAALFLLLHPVWVPLLEGRPDIVGVGILFALSLVYVARPLAEQRLLALLWIGALLATAFLARRWYAYWAVAFFPSAFAAELLRRQGRDWRTHLRHTLRALAVIGASAAAVVLAVAAPRVIAILGEDYTAAYSAYRLTSDLSAEFQAALRYFGQPLVIAMLLGLLALALRPCARYAAVFFGLQVPACFLLFSQVQSFGPHHHYLLLPSLFVGLAALPLVALARAPFALRYTAASVAAVYLLVVLAAVFVPQFRAHLLPAAQAWMPATTRYPKVRSDFDQLEQLLAVLDAAYAADPGPVYVNASSVLLNYSLVRNFCRERRPLALSCDAIVAVGDVDSRDGFPCPLLRSKYVVSTAPVQLHLTPTNQSVIGLPAAAFADGRGIATSFRQLEPTLRLADGARILLFKRQGPIPAGVVHDLQSALQAVHPGQDALYSAARCAPVNGAQP